MADVISLTERRRRQTQERIDELERDLDVYRITTWIIHEGWKLPEFQDLFKRASYDEMYADVSTFCRNALNKPGTDEHTLMRIARGCIDIKYPAND